MRVVYAGFLLPFGHRASLVKVTERKFHPNTPGNTAYLRQRMFIVVGEPQRTFRNTGFVTTDLLNAAATGLKIDHQMPLARVRITTRVTPNLDKPENSALKAGLGQSAFWPLVSGAPFPFHCEAEDLAGNRCDFTLPMVFLEKTLVDATLITEKRMNITVPDLLKLYDADATAARRRADVAGATLAHAVPKTPGDTAFETQSLVFGVQLPSADDYKQLPTDRARFYPVVRRARLLLPAAKHFTGKGEPAEFRYPTVFLKNPLDPMGAPAANKGEVFLEVVPGQEIKLDFGQGGGDKAGGLTKPNMAVSGLSRRLGPIAGPNAISNIAKGSFEPADFFTVVSGAVPAKLFGVIDLWAVVDKLGLDDDINAIPRLLGSEATAIEAFLQDIGVLPSALAKVLAAGGQVQATANAIIADVDSVLARVADANLAELPGVLTALGADVGVLLGLLPGAGNLSDAVKQEAQRLLAPLELTLDHAGDIVAGVEKMIDAVEMAKEGRFRFEWKPRLVNWPASDPIFVAKSPANGYAEDAYFVIAAEIRARTGGTVPPSIDVLCGLERFTLDLIAPARFFGLKFHHIRFVAKPGKKPEVDVLLDGVEFEGPLSFVNALKDLIPLNGFADPPALVVDERGIDASFSLPLPNVAIGVFALSNLSLGAGFTVPFIAEPLSARFFFCQRECPFTLQVSFLGGGGFFGITVDPGGVQILEAALEFGATLSIDLGVASGNVHIMAGIYFRMEQEEAHLEGYLRLGGSVDVLGLITASIELYMSLTYEFSSGKAVGRATITVEVSVLCFSGSVEISCERKFAGSNGDPTFVELMGPDPTASADSPWSEYCASVCLRGGHHGQADDCVDGLAERGPRRGSEDLAPALRPRRPAARPGDEPEPDRPDLPRLRGLAEDGGRAHLHRGDQRRAGHRGHARGDRARLRSVGRDVPPGRCSRGALRLQEHGAPGHPLVPRTPGRCVPPHALPRRRHVGGGEPPEAALGPGGPSRPRRPRHPARRCGRRPAPGSRQGGGPDLRPGADRDAVAAARAASELEHPGLQVEARG